MARRKHTCAFRLLGRYFSDAAKRNARHCRALN
jgi:hypothetical protein